MLNKSGLRAAFFLWWRSGLDSGGDEMKRLFENASSTRHTQFTGAFITS